MSEPLTDLRPSRLLRRSFLTRLGAGVAAFTSAMGLSAHGAAAQDIGGATHTPADQPGFTPARHAQDDWLDQIPGKHRFFFDATTPNGAGEAITFASNYYAANKTGYGLDPSDLAVVICLRHWATPFAFSDVIWERYGTHLAERIKFTDPRTQGAPDINVYQASNYGMLLRSRGTTLDTMIGRGTHFAVCDMATRAFAGIIAGKVGKLADAIYEEMRASAIANSHFAPAGIVAVNRAQERSYSVQYIG